MQNKNNSDMQGFRNVPIAKEVLKNVPEDREGFNPKGENIKSRNPGTQHRRQAPGQELHSEVYNSSTAANATKLPQRMT